MSVRSPYVRSIAPSGRSFWRGGSDVTSMPHGPATRASMRLYPPTGSRAVITPTRI